LKRPVFGDAALLVFLLLQVADGVLTYHGMTILGRNAEGNVLLLTLMNSFGDGVALLCAKVIASVLAICLHLARVHWVVASLAAFYALAACVPWLVLLYF
jgi:hypothetical protein